MNYLSIHFNYWTVKNDSYSFTYFVFKIIFTEDFYCKMAKKKCSYSTIILVFISIRAMCKLWLYRNSVGNLIDTKKKKNRNMHLFLFSFLFVFECYFDTTNYRILLDRLDKLGIGATVFHLFCSNIVQKDSLFIIFIWLPISYNMFLGHVQNSHKNNFIKHSKVQKN